MAAANHRPVSRMPEPTRAGDRQPRREPRQRTRRTIRRRTRTATTGAPAGGHRVRPTPGHALRRTADVRHRPTRSARTGTQHSQQRPRRLANYLTQEPA
jgi:hypothetical protein